MKTWDNKERKFIETPSNVIEFFNELEIIYRKYNLSISHEDGHGAFIIEEYNDGNIDWLKNANLNITK